MRVDEAREFYNQVFSVADGFGVSYNWQDIDAGSRNRNLTYGEIDFDGFLQLLYEVPEITKRRVFYDLGSGVGKVVVAAALLGNFIEVNGIEIVPPLHEQAVMAANHCRALKNLPSINFFQGDFLQGDYTRADLVFTHSTCFSQSLMYALEEALSVLSPGVIVLTVSQSLPKMEIIKVQKYPFKWGLGTVYFHKKS